MLFTYTNSTAKMTTKFFNWPRSHHLQLKICIPEFWKKLDPNPAQSIQHF